MSIEVQERGTLPCTVCGAHVQELRRGRCWGCYTRWAELRPVGRGAACSVCGERRRDNLRMLELHNRSLPMCHTCSARVVKLSAVPETLEGIRDALSRERRRADRREGEAIDHRIFPRERRVGDRRAPSSSALGRGDTDPHGVAFTPDFDDLVIELDEGDVEVVEQTNVRESPVRASRDGK